MLKRYAQFSFSKISYVRCFLSQVTQLTEKTCSESTQPETSLLPLSVVDQETSVLKPFSEDISYISTYLKPTYNLAAYANRSELIQQLVKLGVDLHHIEKKQPETISFLLKLSFEDIKRHIQFFNDLGVDLKLVANVITKNPRIFQERLEDLEIRVNYLKSKNFSDEAIIRIVSKNPFWLSHSTQDIDNKLGFFQSNFKLTGIEVRQIASMKPQLITWSQDKIKVNIFVIKEEMGFSLDDIKQLILVKPQILMNGQHRLLQTFEYLNNKMDIPYECLLNFPGALSCRATRLKQRHQFLVKLRRDQFNPRKPNYISLDSMVKGTDMHFAIEVAKSTIEEFNLFLKTL
ncbi:transcription termination factor 3, mitochondrial [Euwallacea fornicatus]|uniref:transcription termination factor 3, mitochondrial n=1 Tax=Euwallacea fornicatus TaxID=995702 RepID=UPI00338FB78A